MQPITIIHIIMLTAGGILTHITDLIKFCPNKEARHIILNSEKKPINDYARNLLAELNNPLIEIKEFALIDPKNQEQYLKEIICNEKADVIHAAEQVFLPLIHKVCTELNVPFVGVWHHSPMRYIPSNLVNTTLKSLESYPLPQYVTSEYARDAYTKATDYKNFAILPYGSDLEKFKFSADYRKLIRKQYKIPNDAILIGSVTRLDLKHKRPDWFLQAIDYLRKKGHKNVYGLVVGAGKNEQEVYALAQKLKLGNALIFAGWQKNTEQFYSAMDIFAHSSRNESFGQVYTEALGCGLPVVTCAEGPLNSPIKDAYGLVYQGINGLIAHVDDQQEFFDMLEKLIIDKKLRSTLASQARSSIAHRDVRVMAENLYDAFERAIEIKSLKNDLTQKTPQQKKLSKSSKK